MPIYEYQCDECHERFEKFVQSMQNADKGVTCPKCGSLHVHKALSLFGVGGGSKSSSSFSAGSSCSSGST